MTCAINNLFCSLSLFFVFRPPGKLYDIGFDIIGFIYVIANFCLFYNQNLFSTVGAPCKPLPIFFFFFTCRCCLVKYVNGGIV